MTHRQKTYVFANAAHWRRCILHGFEMRADGTLTSIPELGSRPLQILGTAGDRLSNVAVDPHGIPWWRIERVAHGRMTTVLELMDGDEASASFELDRALALAKRWVIDRHGVWAIYRDHVVHRHDRSRLQPDLRIAFQRQHRLRDIASDGSAGVWILSQKSETHYELLHVDCEGCERASLPVSTDLGPLGQIGCVEGGKHLALLTHDGGSLVILDARDGAVLRALPCESIAPGFHLNQLSTDGNNRIALWEASSNPDAQARSLVLLDGAGNLLQQLSDTLDAGAEMGQTQLSAVAIAGDVVWLATHDGLWRLDATDACIARGSTSTLLTPGLLSPESGTERGWLRAEISIALARGAVLAVDVASTRDDAIAKRALDIASQTTVSNEAKQQQIWQLLQRGAPGEEQSSASSRTTSKQAVDDEPFVITGPNLAGVPIAIPLFETQSRWLWLKLRLTAPPGTAAPQLQQLSVLYPNVSIVEQLPAIFRGEQNDPGGFLRRLVGVLESTTQPVDERIRRIGSCVDPHSAPDGWLDYLARWLDLPWDDGLPTAAKRRLMQQAGLLIERRATRQGLELLLQCVLGDQASVRISDLTVDFAPQPLGGRGQVGVRLPMMLVGASPRAVLVSRARVGVAKLPCSGANDGDPLASILPTLRIELNAPRELQRALATLLERLVAAYIPAGLSYFVEWHARSKYSNPIGTDSAVLLDANGPGVLGDDSVIGRTVVTGPQPIRIGGVGIDVGFRLK